MTEEAKTNVVTIDGREFEIGEPNALHIVGLLQVVGRVGTRAQQVTADLGKAVLSQTIPNEAEGAADAGPDLTTQIFAFLAVLKPDDLLDLMATLLQFDDAQAGARWLRKHPPTLQHVIDALTLNLRNSTAIVEALQNFTSLVAGLDLAGLLMAKKGVAEAG